jgi:catechol-2,3-dioxygenase
LQEPYKAATIAFNSKNPEGNHEMIKPTFHHVNLKTTRLQEMIDWYGVVIGATVNLQSNYIAFISNDRTHHRIALLAPWTAG